MRRMKAQSNLPASSYRHPLAVFCHPNKGRQWALALGFLLCAAGVLLYPATTAGSQKRKNSHSDDFVIFANVFTSQGFALPGARMRVRRANEKKFRWEAFSDRRGEMAVRVKQGAEYELEIEARRFKPERRTVDARQGNRVDLTFQLEPLPGGKP
jgi:hypothetical protein